MNFQDIPKGRNPFLSVRSFFQYWRTYYVCGKTVTAWHVFKICQEMFKFNTYMIYTFTHTCLLRSRTIAMNFKNVLNKESLIYEYPIHLALYIHIIYMHLFLQLQYAYLYLCTYIVIVLGSVIDWFTWKHAFRYRFTM